VPGPRTNARSPGDPGAYCAPWSRLRAPGPPVQSRLIAVNWPDFTYKRARYPFYSGRVLGHVFHEQ